MDRRRFIIATGAVALMAGCTGDDSDESDGEADNGTDTADDDPAESDGESGDGTESTLDPPSDDTDPEELLPEPRDGWQQTETGPQPEGEAGVYGVYDKDGQDGYQVAIIRWGSNEKAREEVETFESYTAITYVVLGKFAFISYDNGSGQDPYELLGYSSALTAEYAENNDLIE